MRSEILAGLLDQPKAVSSKYLYDERGSRLFEEICGTEEYYPARVETGILERYADEIAGELGPDVLLVEPGAGNGRKTEILLERLGSPTAYMPIDVSREALGEAVIRISKRFPKLKVFPICADFCEGLPLRKGEGRRPVIFFPGSTIGNFHPWEAAALLRTFGGPTLVGVDLKKDVDILERAYNDDRGVTAEFNLNLLRRLNREYGADFRTRAFRHAAFYDRSRSRVEMHLVSEEEQWVRFDGREIRFRAGESVRTEVSYKYAPEDFERVARGAGLKVSRFWADERDWFGLFWCVPHGT